LAYGAKVLVYTYFSSIVKSSLDPFLEPTSIEFSG